MITVKPLFTDDRNSQKLVMALLVQTCPGLCWVFEINTHVATVDVHSVRMDATIAKIEAVNATRDVRTARLEQKYSAIADVLKHMGDKLIDDRHKAR